VDIDGPTVNRMCKRHGYNLYLSLCWIASVSPLNKTAERLDSPAVNRMCKRHGYNFVAMSFTRGTGNATPSKKFRLFPGSWRSFCPESRESSLPQFLDER
jgi:hypothetical protein